MADTGSSVTMIRKECLDHMQAMRRDDLEISGGDIVDDEGVVVTAAVAAHNINIIGVDLLWNADINLRRNRVNPVISF